MRSRKYMFSLIAVTHRRIERIQPRDGRCNTGSRADAARNSVFKVPKSLLFAGARDSVAGWLGLQHGCNAPSLLPKLDMLTLKYLFSNMCKSSIVVGNSWVYACRIGSNPCRRMHLFFPERLLFFSVRLLFFPQWIKKNSAFSQQCKHIVETMHIGVRAVAEYWLTLNTWYSNMTGSNPDPRKAPFFSSLFFLLFTI